MTPETPTTAASTEDSEKAEAMDFATALEAYSTPEQETVGGEDRVLKGTVLKITGSHVVVDIGQKSEGLVPIAEVTGPDGNVTVQPGDEIDVMVEKGETEEGYINLSHQKAQRLRAWDEIDRAYNDKAAHQGNGHRPHQGRPDGRHSGRARFPARLAGRSSSGAQPGSAEGARRSKSASSS